MRQNIQDPPHDVSFRMTVDGHDRTAPTEMVSSSDPIDAFHTVCTLVGYCVGQLNIGVGFEHRIEIRLEKLSSVQIARLYGLMRRVGTVLESGFKDQQVKVAVADYSITFNRIRS
jgi:hypothetical protein